MITAEGSGLGGIVGLIDGVVEVSEIHNSGTSTWGSGGALNLFQQCRLLSGRQLWHG